MLEVMPERICSQVLSDQTASVPCSGALFRPSRRVSAISTQLDRSSVTASTVMG